MGSLTEYPNGVSSFGIPIYGSGGQPDNSGTVYFVDGNSGSDNNDGKSWDKAMKTLAVAFAASHADMARGSDRWARRNTVYIAGDRFVETLIIAPQKTDLIGVGSCDNFPHVVIRGNHAPVNAAMGTRWFNVQFEPTTAADIMTLTSASTGMEFYNCAFEATGDLGASIVAVSAIDATAHTWLKIKNCTFSGAFTGDVIDIGAGNIDGLEIRNNVIQGGASNGIVVTGTTTVTSSRMALIADNLIQVAGKTIDDGSDDTINIMRNRCISAGASEGAAFVIDEGHAVDNVITYNDTTSVMVPIIPSA
jgi:hypothetical protein